MDSDATKADKPSIPVDDAATLLAPRIKENISNENEGQSDFPGKHEAIDLNCRLGDGTGNDLNSEFVVRGHLRTSASVASTSNSSKCNESKSSSRMKNILDKDMSVSTNKNEKDRSSPGDGKGFEDCASGHRKVHVETKCKARSDDSDDATSPFSNDFDLNQHMANSENKFLGEEACLDNFGGHPHGVEEGNAAASMGGEYMEGKHEEANGSEESVEGSDNVQSVSSGKRKHLFDQQLTIKSNKLQKLCNGTSCSTSFHRDGSSFMIWISNMVRGLSEVDSGRKLITDSSKEVCTTKEPSKSLVLIDTKENYTHDKVDNFQTFFRSLSKTSSSMYGGAVQTLGSEGKNFSGHGYSSSPLDKDTKLGHGNIKSKYTEMASALVPRIGFRQSNLQGSTSDAIDVEENHKTMLEGNSNLMEMDVHQGNIAEKLPKISPDHPSGEMSNNMPIYDVIKGKEVVANTHTSKEDLGKNIWLARFARKSNHSALESNLPVNGKGKPISEFAAVDGCSSPKHTNSLGAGSERKLECTANEVHIFSAETHEKAKGMQSILHRSHVNKEDSSSKNLTRFDVDAQNHASASGFQEIADSTFSAIGHLLSKSSLASGYNHEHGMVDHRRTGLTGEHSLFCTRCFKHDHCVSSCPSPRDTNQSKGKNVVQPNHSFSTTSCRADHGRSTGKQAEVIGNGKTRMKQSSSLHLSKRRATEDTKLDDNHSSSCSGDLPKDKGIKPYWYSQRTVVPSETLDKIRKLQLSRCEIVRWMKVTQLSHHLQGFFLRVRFGNSRDEVGGGYYVACICGLGAGGTSRQSSNMPLLVSFGGFKCYIESRFVSNQNFTEEELTTWWLSTVSGIDKMPSEEDINMKLEEKRQLTNSSLI